MKYLILLIALFATPAFAQQASPSQLALQINSAISNMALGLERDQAVIQQLQAEVKRLTEKYEPKQAPEEKKP